MLNRLAIAVTGAVALATVLIPVAALAAPAGDSQQQIYLDPETGDVIADPAGQTRQAPSAQRRPAVPEAERQSDTGRQPKAWTNDDGADMITLDPDAAPSRDAVRCANGSLRIGHADASGDQGPREALCAQPQH